MASCLYRIHVAQEVRVSSITHEQIIIESLFHRRQDLINVLVIKLMKELHHQVDLYLQLVWTLDEGIDCLRNYGLNVIIISSQDNFIVLKQH